MMDDQILTALASPPNLAEISSAIPNEENISISDDDDDKGMKMYNEEMISKAMNGEETNKFGQLIILKVIMI
jgi:hypothetical protein